MRRSIRQALWLLAITLVSKPLTAAPQGVAGLNVALASALKAGDLDALMRLHEKDAVFYPPGARDQKGEEAIRFKWERLLKINTIKDASFVDTTYASAGDLSTGWGHVRLTLQPKSGEEPITISGRFSTVAKRRNGKWLYVFVSVGELDEILTFEHYSKAPRDNKK
jgi:ketosteroid isomerase-like protein